MPGFYQLTKSENNSYGFDLHAENGKTILSGEWCKSRYVALNAIEACRENSTLDYQYVFMNSDDGQPYFVLVAENGKVIGTSEMFATAFARENAVDSVKRNAASLIIKDGRSH